MLLLSLFCCCCRCEVCDEIEFADAEPVFFSNVRFCISFFLLLIDEHFRVLLLLVMNTLLLLSLLACWWQNVMRLGATAIVGDDWTGWLSIACLAGGRSSANEFSVVDPVVVLFSGKDGFRFKDLISDMTNVGIPMSFSRAGNFNVVVVVGVVVIVVSLQTIVFVFVGDFVSASSFW